MNPNAKETAPLEADESRTSWEVGGSAPCPDCESTGPAHFEGCEYEESHG